MENLSNRKMRSILTRKPFVRMLATSTNVFGSTRRTNDISVFERDVDEQNEYLIVTQADFLREYYPYGHRINSEAYYPDIIKYDEEHKKYFKEFVIRCSFAFQKVITVKQVVHICGNDVQFELPTNSYSKENEDLFHRFHKGWAEKNMEVLFYESVRSRKITGDAAFVGCMKGGKFYGRVFSYLNGDTLYPHYDTATGRVNLFARRYYDYDDKGEKRVQHVEIWDDTNLYHYIKDEEANDMVATFRKLFRLDGYRLVDSGRHGFSSCPVAYTRDDEGACWTPSQECIDQYEMSYSQLAQSNKNYAFPIMYFKGDDVAVEGDMNNAVKSIAVSSDGDVGFLNHPDVSESFDKQMNLLYKMIYELSFAVIPPELKSGDLPGVAVKMLFSPAYEKALCDAHELSPFLNRMVDIFKEGFGLEEGVQTQLMGLPLNTWIEPYVHQNDTELITNLAAGVQNDFISHQTATERSKKYTRNDEWERILREKKQQMQQDIIEAAEKNLDKVEAEVHKQAMLNVLEAGNDVNTAHGKVGRPNISGRVYDENGNWDGRNNWDILNK